MVTAVAGMAAPVLSFRLLLHRWPSHLNGISIFFKLTFPYFAQFTNSLRQRFRAMSKTMSGHGKGLDPGACNRHNDN